MRVLSSTYGSRGDVEQMVGVAVRLRALGAPAAGGVMPAGVRRDAGRGAAMTGHAVVVAGGGPTGLMLARRSTIGSSHRAGGSGRGVRLDPSGHRRLSHAAQLRARAVAVPHRAHPGRLGRRAEGADLSRT
jgi:hypothetical protein